MAAITYGTGAPAATTASVKPTTSVWTRLWDAFVDARMRQAMREVALHRHLLPGELEAAYNRGSAKTNP